MADVEQRIRDRLGPLIERERVRLKRLGDARCDLPTRRLSWEITRIIDDFEDDEESLRVWMHIAPIEDVRPIICGFDRLLDDAKRGDLLAGELAQAVAKAKLSVALRLMAGHWMFHMPYGGLGGQGREDAGAAS